MLKPKPIFIFKSFKFCKKAEILFLPKSDLYALVWKYFELRKSKSRFLNSFGKLREIFTTFMKSKMKNSTVLMVKIRQQFGRVGAMR